MKKTWKSLIAIVLVLSLLAAPVLADDNMTTFFSKMDDIMTIIQTYYHKDVKLADLMDGALKGMFSVLDKHSVYFTPEEYKEFNSDIHGEFAGVGIYIEQYDDYIKVVAPIEGTPAFRAGVKTGDVIMYVDGKDIKGYSTEQAAAMIKGEPGTKVKIGIKREGTSGIITMELTRETIKVKPVKYEIMKDNIGYIRITQFNGNGYEDFAKAVDEFKAKNVKGVVIDVRNNPGGLLDEVINMCKLIVPEGPVVHIQYKNRPLQTHNSDLASAPFKIMMLVDEGSASASEIMAGAIKDSGVGKLVGQNTYGKGTVQSILDLPDESGLKITVANYLTPSKYSLDGKGIKPHFEVKNATVAAMADLSPINGKRVIKEKLVGLDVLGVQQRLKELGYFAGTPDGVFGKTTVTAVNKFFKDNKLKQDSSLDTADIKALNTKFEAKINSKDAQLDKAITELKKLIK